MEPVVTGLLFALVVLGDLACRFIQTLYMRMIFNCDIILGSMAESRPTAR
jgi:hypothetical protein